MFKLALSAGHYLGSEKGCPEYLDPKKTREWTLNDRIADNLEALLAEYDGVEILRLDDTSGKQAVSLEDRTDAANDWEADFYLSIHHNGGIGGGKGGGIVAYVYTYASDISKEWQRDLYDAAVAATGLRGKQGKAACIEKSSRGARNKNARGACRMRLYG
jgi:N-acetylmuramoyl-L-alanine amidase